jgi:hypothetical protein
MELLIQHPDGERLDKDVNKHEKWHCDRIFFINIRRLFFLLVGIIEKKSVV